MPDDKDALLAHFRGMRAEFREAIQGLTPAQMAERTLDGWSVKDHLFHLAAWDDVRTQEVRRISAGHSSTWRMTPAQDDELNALLWDLRKDLGVDQALWEWQSSRARLLEAIEQTTPRGLDASLYGEAGLRSGHESEHAGWVRRWRTEKGY